MGLSRAELKIVIKDLLVEILSEGLGNVQAAASRPPAPGRVPISGIAEQKRAVARRRPDFDPRLDTPLLGGRMPTAELKEAVKRNAGGNPIMQAILADTATTTLPTLLANDRQLGQNEMPDEGTAHGVSQVEQINGTPEEVFGEEASGRWADLAFPAPKKLL
jgi:hypothetical protein